jgi:hypothetical protein
LRFGVSIPLSSSPSLSPWRAPAAIIQADEPSLMLGLAAGGLTVSTCTGSCAAGTYSSSGTAQWLGPGLCNARKYLRLPAKLTLARTRLPWLCIVTSLLCPVCGGCVSECFDCGVGERAGVGWGVPLLQTCHQRDPPCFRVCVPCVWWCPPSRPLPPPLPSLPPISDRLIHMLPYVGPQVVGWPPSLSMDKHLTHLGLDPCSPS